MYCEALIQPQSIKWLTILTAPRFIIIYINLSNSNCNKLETIGIIYISSRNRKIVTYHNFLKRLVRQIY
jgi:hypothetical protein